MPAELARRRCLDLRKFSPGVHLLMIAAVAIGLATGALLFRSRSTTAGWLALAALVLMVGVMAVTLAVEVAIDDQIKTWTVETLPVDWMAIRARWAAFHTFRTFLSLASVAAAVAAALAPRAATGQTSTP